MGFFSGRRVTVTGGASFIGSHLSAALLAGGAAVRVVDNFSSGTEDNLRDIADDIEVLRADLRSPELAADACAKSDIVFHLAAAHGGRGYIDSHACDCAENMVLDQNVFRAAVRAGVDQVVFASSACVYPTHLQADPGGVTVLDEHLAGPPYDPDGLYGMAKLCGEQVLRALHAEHGIGATVCRYFTAYGPRCGETHAIMAMIARAFVGADPFEVWGTGAQVRTWIHVDDLVRLTLLAGQRATDGTPVNVATDEAHTVLEVAELVCAALGHEARIVPRPDRPTGPLCRVAGTARATALLGARPEIDLAEGIRRTVEWYVRTKNRADIAGSLDTLLVEHATASGRADSLPR